MLYIRNFFLLIFLFSCSKKKINIFYESTSHLRLESSFPFYHGVASGDPLHDGIILWTRVTPKFIDQEIVGEWYLSSDSTFKNIFKKGEFTTNLDKDFTIKIDVRGLEPGKNYYYYFNSLGHKSIVGKTKTMSLDSDELNFAIISCSDYQRGYFNSYAALANENNLDAVIHLGDYIYEYKARDYSNGIFNRLHIPDKELISLEDYRTRYSQYRLDPDLIKAHASHPFIVIWDDHETSNDTYMTGAQNHQVSSEGSFIDRKQNAMQAYYEWLPIRENIKPYRHFSYGKLVDLLILEERFEGRTKQASDLEDPSLYDSSRSMLGSVQLDWFLNKLKNSKAKWKVIGNQVIFSYLNYGREDFKINLDSWDGYPEEREMIASFIQKNNIKNVVIATGDTHQSWAFEVNHIPFTNKKAYAFEFGTPSISAGNSDERYLNAPIDEIIEHEKYITNSPINPHLKYSNTRDHGYLILSFNDKNVIAKWVYVNPLFNKSDLIKNIVQIKGEPEDYSLDRLTFD